jgi:hypothetical protein
MKTLTIIFSDESLWLLGGLPASNFRGFDAVAVQTPLWRWQSEPWGLLLRHSEPVEGSVDRYRFPWSSISAAIETIQEPQ